MVLCASLCPPQPRQPGNFIIVHTLLRCQLLPSHHIVSPGRRLAVWHRGAVRRVIYELLRVVQIQVIQTQCMPDLVEGRKDPLLRRFLDVSRFRRVSRPVTSRAIIQIEHDRRLQHTVVRAEQMRCLYLGVVHRGATECCKGEQQLGVGRRRWCGTQRDIHILRPQTRAFVYGCIPGTLLCVGEPWVARRENDRVGELEGLSPLKPAVIPHAVVIRSQPVHAVAPVTSCIGFPEAEPARPSGPEDRYEYQRGHP
ncbi:MAG: hypothetical protein BWY79_01948 [Actinobacteria bacterium ADurb.Bin444]|nr:MAG: hypothetical protein BWY79_01948 [Actinobacteria bacterium ADurb.Bin444]